MIQAFLVYFSYHINIPVAFYCSLLLVFAIYGNHNCEDSDDGQQNTVLNIIGSPYMMALYSLPLAASLLSWIHDLVLRQRKLSKIYDIDEKEIQPLRRWRNTPFLPDAAHTPKEKWDKIYMTLKDEIKMKKTRNSEVVDGERFKWALITGASRGIGRAIAVELARLNVPLILVARDKKRLTDLSTLLQECYGVPTMILTCDFAQPNAAQELYDATCKAKCTVDVLINNAGLAETSELINMDEAQMDRLTNVNVLTPTKLCQLYGRDMKDRKRGRILIMSSLTGAVPGVPTSAVYAATKAYQRSLATSLRRELESHGVGVTCIMPGAVKETSFASTGNMTSSLVWDFPLGNLTPETVASSSIKAMIVGYQEVVVGWTNTILVKVALYLLPPRIILMVAEYSWLPSPFRASSEKKKDTSENEDFSPTVSQKKK